MIKSLGSDIEFQKLYFSPSSSLLKLSPNWNNFSLLAGAVFFSFAGLVFSIFTIKYAELVPFGNQRR